MLRPRQWFRAHFNEAIRAYKSGSDKDLRKREIARTTYHKALTLRKTGLNQQADEEMTTAVGILQEILGKTLDAPTESSFEKLVSPWAR